MKVSFTKDFQKSLTKINNKKLALQVLSIIAEVENAKSIIDINSIKKLKGHRTAFRIRTGHFRIGLFIENDEVLFAIIDHRKDIYKKFP